MINNDESMKDIVQFIVERIVEDIEHISIEEKIGLNSSSVSIMTSNRQDTAKIIGKDGNTIKSLKSIIRAIGAKKNIKCNLYIID
jgi:predicted RNA-binding protein YlqC (UPF0109 family)